MKATSWKILLEKVAALGLEGAGVGAERGEDGSGFGGAEALEEWWIGAEDAWLCGDAVGVDAVGFGRVRYGEGFEEFLRGGAAGLARIAGMGSVSARRWIW